MPSEQLSIFQGLRSSKELQYLFDIVFGIVAPLLCLAFDPVIFRDSGPCFKGFLSGYAIFAYGAIGLGVIALSVWLGVGPWLNEQLAALFAGIFFIGSGLALLIGVVLIPLTLIGLLFSGLGLLGLIPYLTALVYWANCRRAWRKASNQLGSPPAFPLMIASFGLVIVLAIPSLAQWQFLSFFPPEPAPVSNCSSATE